MGVRGGDDVDVELVEVGDTGGRPDPRVVDGDDEAPPRRGGRPGCTRAGRPTSRSNEPRGPTATGEAVDQVVRRRRIEVVGRHQQAPHDVRAGERQRAPTSSSRDHATTRPTSVRGRGPGGDRHAANGTFDRPRTLEEWNRSTLGRSSSYAGEPADELLQRHPLVLETSEGGPEAEVDAVTEGQVPLDRPVGDEARRIGELAGVAVAGPLTSRTIDPSGTVSPYHVMSRVVTRPW